MVFLEYWGKEPSFCSAAWVLVMVVDLFVCFIGSC